jgi:hypothetical protein
MTGASSRIPDGARRWGRVLNLWGTRAHQTMGGTGDLNAMRILYLVVTVLLIVSLGLLEVVAARGVSFTP